MEDDVQASGRTGESAWQDCVVIRRILHAAISYPFWKLFGFDKGGFAANAVMMLAAFYAFVFYFRRRLGSAAAITGMWLLATYPGTTYWVGVPYAYAIIVPCCLLASIALWELIGHRGWPRLISISLGVGVLALGYDLLPFFWRRTPDHSGRLKAVRSNTGGWRVPVLAGGRVDADPGPRPGRQPGQ